MGQWRATADIPATAIGPAAARHLVATLVRGWQLEPLIDAAELVVTELVTNAILHAPGEDSCELELVAHAGRLRITVANGSAIRPVVAELQPDQTHGRGLHAVEALATRWGVDDHHGGKRVWGELAVPGKHRNHLTPT
jgi:anti-sigma regulatory factor (Ser/Thr protein kinase)